MKRLPIAIILLFASVSWAGDICKDNSCEKKTPLTYARVNAAVIGGGGGAAAGGTWVMAPAAHGETLALDGTSYFVASKITVSGTHITQIAYKVQAVGNASTGHIKLMVVGESTVLAKADCAPATGSWCKATVDYTAGAGAQYWVVAGLDGSTSALYDDTDASVGAYGAIGNYTDYAGWVASDTCGFVNDAWAPSVAVAICYGGTCSGEPD